MKLTKKQPKLLDHVIGEFRFHFQLKENIPKLVKNWECTFYFGEDH
ncbi:MAG: hypothetical protein HOB40_01355 [Candidatus Marinimicrobia bacterium]|jgi:hypothetical protein|nr:hypothetical protein [Candidatus Neomarinimicrobiota bacterium]MBT3501123.1 hypothetical protein [Candidatus Neomarinimicrobiota bacterium]MBT3840519.1 hypothetical protein [Candidatus Neomarinimicrobiota bacterium]MBT3999370.1 hypothetical protein [Candidatus Neomarinimicrobiota bacterium]MBT4578455.1 hypothetical protein [Candidatus Neomarinimicrobiota bacterium]